MGYGPVAHAHLLMPEVRAASVLLLVVVSE